MIDTWSPKKEKYHDDPIIVWEYDLAHTQERCLLPPFLFDTFLSFCL
jgi:hypothetical protein